MGKMEILINEEGALKVVQHYDLRYVNTTVRAKHFCNIPVIFLRVLECVYSCLVTLFLILNVFIAGSYEIQAIKT